MCRFEAQVIVGIPQQDVAEDASLDVEQAAVGRLPHREALLDIALSFSPRAALVPRGSGDPNDETLARSLENAARLAGQKRVEDRT